MSFASRHNAVTFRYDFDTENFEYLKCSDLEENKTYKVFGYFSSTGMYGKQYTLVTDKFFLNLPKYMVDDMEELTEEDIKDIKNGKVGVMRNDYKSKQGRKCSTVTWVDLA